MDRKSASIVRPMSTWAWRSPSVQLPHVSLVEAFLKPLASLYENHKKVSYYTAVPDTHAIYYDWHKVGEDLRNAMLYYSVDGREQTGGEIKSAGTRSAPASTERQTTER